MATFLFSPSRAEISAARLPTAARIWSRGACCCPETCAERHARRAAQDANYTTNERPDACAFSGAHVTGLVIMHLALGILPDDCDIFEVELRLFLCCLHGVWRLAGGQIIENRRHQEADGRHALPLRVAHRLFRGACLRFRVVQVSLSMT
jgi:hypothetical protein